MSDKHEEFLAFMRACERRARCYVQGTSFHERLKSVQPVSGGWSAHFKTHPRVIEAEAEGWGRDLRAACVEECRQRLLRGQDVGHPDDLMPARKEWWAGVRAQAQRFRDGEAYRARMLGPVETSAPRRPLPRVDRTAWRSRYRRRTDRQLESATEDVLSELSRRMTGEAASGE